MGLKIRYLIFCSGLLLLMGCQKDPNVQPEEITYGKNRFTIMQDGDEREYYVHVPAAYTGNSKVPVVFMLHGTSGNGEEFYNNSGWKEVGEAENILTVFPSSRRSCIIDDGVVKTTTKWNSQPAHNWSYCAGVNPKDDIRFFEMIIDELSSKYKIDEKRVYIVGFSNGGQMAAKCSILLSSKIAAVVESASSFSFDTTFVPQRKLPIAFQIGNEDYGPGGSGPELPLSNLGPAIDMPGSRLNYISQTHINSFDLNPSYTITGDTNTVVIATFKPLSGNMANSFNMALIKGLKHAYPNGTNHWMHAAEVHWEWLKQFSLP